MVIWSKTSFKYGGCGELGAETVGFHLIAWHGGQPTWSERMGPGIAWGALQLGQRELQEL